MKKIFSLLLATAALSLTGCVIKNSRSIEGSGNVVEQDRHLSGFSNVRVENGMNLKIEHADKFQVIVKADDNVQPHVMTNIEEGTLVIRSDYNSFTDVTMSVIVRMPMVNKIEADGGTSVQSQNTLVGESIDIEADGGSSVELDLEADHITASADSGSSVKLRGKALSFTVSSDEGSSVDANGLLANDVTVDASSGSSIRVQPAVSLTANASSGSSVTYRGNPKNVTEDEDSGGSVSRD